MFINFSFFSWQTWLSTLIQYNIQFITRKNYCKLIVTRKTGSVVSILFTFYVFLGKEIWKINGNMAKSFYCTYIVISVPQRNIYAVVQIFLWFENFETSLLLAFLCLLSMVMNLRKKGNKNQAGLKTFKPKKNFNHSLIFVFLCPRLKTKKKIEPQHTHFVVKIVWGP